jgi:hypothetical protein
MPHCINSPEVTIREVIIVVLLNGFASLVRWCHLLLVQIIEGYFDIVITYAKGAGLLKKDFYFTL